MIAGKISQIYLEISLQEKRRVAAHRSEMQSRVEVVSHADSNMLKSEQFRVFFLVYTLRWVGCPRCTILGIHHCSKVKSN